MPEVPERPVSDALLTDVSIQLNASIGRLCIVVDYAK
jgi:hypothetical protein